MGIIKLNKMTKDELINLAVFLQQDNYKMQETIKHVRELVTHHMNIGNIKFNSNKKNQPKKEG
jgi:hypothetical protein